MIKNKKTQSLLNLGLFLGIIVFLNILGNFFYNYIDLTEEKRFTLTKATQNILNDLEEVVYVQVLFDGDFPAGIKRLQTAVQETLEDFRSETSYVEYSFENPYDGEVNEINARVEELKKDGIVPLNMRIVDVDGTKEVFGYPYALFHYGGRTFPVDFLENTPGKRPDENINNSIRLLEYKFINAIQKLQQYKRPNIVFSSGHGELTKEQTIDLERNLEQFYNVDRINLDSVYHLPSEDVAVLVIAKPIIPFSEKSKFVIDQYIMNGGKVLWLIDGVNAALDSMRRKDFLSLERQLNLEDMWFKYGFRINNDLVQDLENTKIPQVIDAQGTLDLFDWYYHLKVLPRSNHPIVKGLNPINLFFPSSIDTVRTKTDVKTTILLQSSQYSKRVLTPFRLDFDILRYAPEPNRFNKPFQTLAILEEGQFPSLFENRVTESMQAGLEELHLEPKYISPPTKMIVVADGDVAKNWPPSRTGKIPPLGYNIYERRLYANKVFLINAIEYLMDKNGVIEARAKEVKLRLLDMVKARQESTKWQLINIVLPLVFLAIFGFIFNWWRRRRFA